MKRFVLYAVALAIFLFAGVLPLWAKDATATVNPTLKSDRGTVRLTTIPERITAAVARVTQAEERKDAREQTVIQRKELALQIAEDKLKILDALWARVESRMKKMQDAGRDLSSLSAKIADVKQKRQTAADAIDQAKTVIMQETTPGTPVQKLKQQRLKVVPSLRAYHQAIVTVITSLLQIQAAHLLTPRPLTTPGS